MRILHRAPRDGPLRVQAESLDDLWELSHIITPGDTVRAKTERKVAVGADKSDQVRKPMTLTIAVNTSTLEHGVLRVQGTITEGPEDLISYGDHHSITIAPGTDFLLTKTWDAVSRQRFAQACEARPLNILLVVFDRETATLAELTRRGHTVIQTISGNVAKKQPGGGTENFWNTIAEAVTQQDTRQQYAAIVAASPAFWNEYLVKELPEATRKKIITASCNATGEAAIHEVLRRPELTRALEQDRTSTETRLLEDVLSAISKDRACYGIDACATHARDGQMQLLIVSMHTVERARAEGWYEKLDTILEQAKRTRADVHLIRHVTEQLDAIGGIAGVLRW